MFIKTVYVSTAAERKGSSTFYLVCVVTADKEEAVTTHELTHATSTPAHEQKKRHRDCFDSTHRTYISRSVSCLQYQMGLED